MPAPCEQSRGLLFVGSHCGRGCPQESPPLCLILQRGRAGVQTGNFLQSFLAIHRWEGGRLGASASGVCRRRGKGRKPRCVAVFCTRGHPKEEKSELQVQGWSLKAGSRKGIRMEERSYGRGWASILLTQGSIRPNVQYCGFSGHCGFWKPVCDVGTMIQMTTWPTDTVKEKVLERNTGELFGKAFPRTYSPVLGGKDQRVCAPILACSVSLSYRFLQ